MILSLFERHLLIQVLTSDRASPSKERARLRRLVLGELTAAAGVAEIEDLFVEGRRVVELLREKITVPFSAGALQAVKDFATEALTAKGPDGLALLDGLAQDHLLSLIDRTEEERKPHVVKPTDA